MESSHSSASCQSQDEIDLIELTKLLWNNRLVILLGTLVFLGLGIAIAFYLPPLYKTHTTAQLPAQADLADYNRAAQLDPGLETLTPDQAFLIFIRKIESTNLRLDFFENHYLPEQPNPAPEPAEREQMWANFNKALHINTKTDKNLWQAQIEFEGETPQLISRWANEYLLMGIDAARAEILGNMTSAIQTRLKTLDDQIYTLRQAAEQDRQNQIFRLQEALSLANEIGLELPPSSGNLITSFTEEMSYLRGSKALHAELEILKARQNNDPFIPGLPELLKQKSLLESIDIDPDTIRVATIDGTATTPERPFKPNKKLILAVSILLGGMISVFFVLVRHAFHTSRRI